MRRIVALAAMLVAALVQPARAEAAWRRAETANFIVYSQAPEAELRDDAVLLEDYLSLLRVLTGIDDPPPPHKLSVYVLRDHDEMNVVAPSLGESTAGFYVASESGIGAFAESMRGFRAAIGRQVLFHEIAHHFMMQYRPIAYPPWYIEGFAEFVSTATIDAEKFEIGKPSGMRAGWLIYAHWLPLEKIIFPKPTDLRNEDLFYAESWLLTHYLVRDDARRAKLIDYLNATARGEDPKAAFTRIFAVAPAAMLKDMRDYAFKRMTFSRLTRTSGAAKPAVTVKVLPPSADDLLLLDAAMHVFANDRRGPALLGKVRSAARKSDDPFSRRVLAEAEALYGDGEAADRLLQPLIAGAPNDAELLYWEGMRHLVAARRGGDRAAMDRKLAQGWLVKAHQADPNHYQTLSAYAESLVGEPQFVSENTTNVLLLAHALAPQVNGITLDAARMLMLQGKFDQATALLTPLAAQPHDLETAAKAQALLVLAKESKPPPEPPFAAPPKRKDAKG